MENVTTIVNLLETLVIFFSNPLTVYGIMGLFFLLLLKSKNIKFIKIGRWITFEGKDTKGQKVSSSIINCRDVKQYHLILSHLLYAPSGLLSDIRYRVRKNGWEKKTDWTQYVQDAIEGHRNTMTQFLDLVYPEEALIDRIELFEGNKAVQDAVVARYKRMYDTMYAMFIGAHKEADELRKELEKPVYCTLSFRNQDDQKLCLTIPRIIDIVNRIRNIEGVELKENCMNEAERAVKDVLQIYYSRYLNLYISAKKREKQKRFFGRRQDNEDNYKTFAEK